MIRTRYLGVDGCKAGWFFVAIGPGKKAEFGVFQHVDKLFYTYSDPQWILIDIPNQPICPRSVLTKKA